MRGVRPHIISTCMHISKLRVRRGASSRGGALVRSSTAEQSVPQTLGRRQVAKASGGVRDLTLIFGDAPRFPQARVGRSARRTVRRARAFGRRRRDRPRAQDGRAVARRAPRRVGLRARRPPAARARARGRRGPRVSRTVAGVGLGRERSCPRAHGRRAGVARIRTRSSTPGVTPDERARARAQSRARDMPPAHHSSPAGAVVPRRPREHDEFRSPAHASEVHRRLRRTLRTYG